jgi:aminopeptidase N
MISIRVIRIRSSIRARVLWDPLVMFLVVIDSLERDVAAIAPEILMTRVARNNRLLNRQNTIGSRLPTYTATKVISFIHGAVSPSMSEGADRSRASLGRKPDVIICKVTLHLLRRKQNRMVKRILALAVSALVPVLTAGGSQPRGAQAEEAGNVDINHYKISAELLPDSHTLKAQTVVTFKSLKQTQSAILEMNGSLIISNVAGPDGKPLQFIQDRVNEMNVKINLGQLYSAGSEIRLTFDYAGPLATPEGGPVADRRLAYVGPEGSYLFYAARWFPFHGYASDRATSEIAITVPGNWLVAGHSNAPVTSAPTKDGRKSFSFVETQPVLPGSFAAGQFINRQISSGGTQVDLFVLPGSEGRAEEFGKEIAQIVQLYNARFGQYAFGHRYVVAEVDDETLETYSGTGIAFLSHPMLTSAKALPVEELAREVAYQWWGQAVGLKSFDDAWLSQGLAEYSSLLYRESQQSPAELQQTLSEIIELALAFEQDASIARAPAQVNDQSPAFRSVIFYKGAYVFHMLRTTIGDDKFFNLLKSYYTTYNGKNASIDAFEALAEKVAASNLRGFFGLWVDSTGVPEFKVDYSILRTKDGKFKVRGTVRQNLDSFRGPITVALESEGGRESKATIDLKGTSADFELASDGKPLDVVVDPENRYLRISEVLRTSVIVRRGIQHFQREEYAEAEEDFRSALKVSPRSSWAWYNLGLLYMEQRNWEKAREYFTETLNGDLEPSWLEVWSYIYKGNAWDADGNRDRAVAEYNKAKENANNYNNAQRAVEKYLGQPYKRERSSATGN